MSSASSHSPSFKNSKGNVRRMDNVKGERASSSSNNELFTLGQSATTVAIGWDSRCQICGDKATGRHYGAVSCDGCKGFFRRSIRKRQSYQCRHQKTCNIDRDKRNQCRYCRLQKCIRIGMKQEAVQSERDRISSSRNSNQQSSTPTVKSKPEQGMLSLIQSAEMVFLQQGPPPTSPIGLNSELQEAGVDELLNSMKDQVLLLVQWAKRFPSFMQLAVSDQICLLKAHASEHLLFGVTRRSLNQSHLLLGNSYIISRQSPENSFALIAGRVLDQFLAAYRTINVDDVEYACLKAIVFFDPYADGLQARDIVFNTRQEIILALYGHIRINGSTLLSQEAQPVGARESSANNSQSPASSPHTNNSAAGDSVPDFSLVKRFGELLLLVPTVRSIAEDMVDHIKFYKLFGAAKVDNVLHELLLGDPGNDDNIQPVPGPSQTIASGRDSQSSSYPSSGAHSPTICNAPPMETPSSELYTPTMLSQPGFAVSSISSSPADHTFDATVTPVAASSFNGSFGVLGACIPPAVSLMATQRSQGLNGNSPTTQSPGLSALAAAAFVASQSLGAQSSAMFPSNGVFLSPPADHYASLSEMEPPHILALAFSNRPPVPLGRRSSQPTPLPRNTPTMKPEQTE